MLEAIAQNSAQAYLKYRKFDAMRRDFLRTYGFTILMLLLALMSFWLLGVGMALILVALSALYPLMLFLSAKSAAKTLVKEHPKYEETSVHYVFTTQNMSVMASNERTPTTYAYTDFYSVYETKEYFYFYLDPKESLILPKDSFRVGKSEDLTRILKAHLLPVRKYIKK